MANSKPKAGLPNTHDNLITYQGTVKDAVGVLRSKTAQEIHLIRKFKILET
jgi:hypothetical protein